MKLTMEKYNIYINLKYRILSSRNQIKRLNIRYDMTYKNAKIAPQIFITKFQKFRKVAGYKSSKKTAAFIYINDEPFKIQFNLNFINNSI